MVALIIKEGPDALDPQLAALSKQVLQIYSESLRLVFIILCPLVGLAMIASFFMIVSSTLSPLIH